MIIIEGMDNTGKTTLGKQLAHRFNLNFYDRPKRGFSTSELVKEAYFSFEVEDRPECGIFDRHPLISEPVYGPIIRGKNAIHAIPETEQFLYNKLLNCEPLIIFCKPPKSTVIKFEDGRDQMEGVIEKASQLYDAYVKVIRELVTEGFGILVYDYTKAQNGDIDVLVAGYLARWEEKNRR